MTISTGDPLGAGQLGGQAEVEPVARVVLDDQQRTRRGPATAGSAASTASGLGEVKTSPATAAASIPRPT